MIVGFVCSSLTVTKEKSKRWYSLDFLFCFVIPSDLLLTFSVAKDLSWNFLYEIEEEEKDKFILIQMTQS